MKVIDPGHRYKLDSLDGEGGNELVFVMQESIGPVVIMGAFRYG